MSEPVTVREAARDVPVVAKTDVVVVGGGSAGIGAAVSSARNGASVTVLERYPHLGGMASGGMVLVLDDMINGQEVTVTGIMTEYIDRMTKIGAAVTPPLEDRLTSEAMWKKWSRWGCMISISRQNHSRLSMPRPLIQMASSAWQTT